MSRGYTLQELQQMQGGGGDASSGSSGAKQGFTLQQLEAMRNQSHSQFPDQNLNPQSSDYSQQSGQQSVQPEQSAESQGAVKQSDGTYRAPTFWEGLKQSAIGAANFIGSQAIGLGQFAVGALGKSVPGYDTRQQAIKTGEDLKTQMQPENQAQKGGAIAANVAEIALPLADTAASLITNAPEITKGVISGVKEFISPSLTSEEQVGKIIQGKISDIPSGQRTLNALPSNINPTKMTPKELSTAIEENIIKKNLNQTDTYFSSDSKIHSMSEFEKTVGKGSSEVKTNYVKQAIEQLKKQYVATNDAQGLSDIKSLEDRANTKGLSSQELNNLAKEHGRVINAFNANGEAASGLSKQAAENTRSGVKGTAREMLAKSNSQASLEATRLDKETADAIKTKDLLDKQVQKESTKIQKYGKPNVISKFSKEHPVVSRVARYGIPVAVYEEAKKLGAPLP